MRLRHEKVEAGPRFAFEGGRFGLHWDQWGSSAGRARGHPV